MRLIETWLADQERAFDLFAKFPAEETGFENPAAGMNRERFAAYVRGLRDESLGVGLPDGWVPATKYILVNGIAREYRGHGYATAGLKITLAKARELGIEEAYLSVHKTNPASLAVQQHCGARIDHEDKTEYYTRIATAGNRKRSARRGTR